MGDESVQIVPLGLYILKGDSVALVCQLDSERETAINWESMQNVAPLRSFHTVEP